MSTNLADLLDGPAGPPPPGVVPQLDNPPNESAASYFITIFSIVFVTLIISVQLYTRAFITRNFGFPEYALATGYCLYMAFCAETIVACSVAPGVHTWDLRLKHLRTFLYALHVNSILYGTVVLAIKLSILAQFFPLFMPFKEPRIFYWSTLGFMVLNAIVFFALTCLEIWACKPIRKAWDPFVKDGHCINISVLNVGAAVINVATDTGIFILPQASIWRLHMALKTKAAYASIFLVAIFCITAATARLYYSVAGLSSTDEIWNSWILGVTALVEINFAFLCACMPAIPAFTRWANQNRPLLLTSGYWRGSHSQSTARGKTKKSGILLQNQGHGHNPHVNPTRPGFYTRAYDSSVGGSDYAIGESKTPRNV